MKTVVAQITKSCDTCLKNNPKTLPLPPALVKPIQYRGSYPGENWQIESIQMPRSQGYKYLLLMVDTFTSCIEAFPTWTECASKVTKKLFKEIILGLVYLNLYKVIMSPHECLDTKSFQSCLTLCNLWTVDPQAPLSTGFSRQEHSIAMLSSRGSPWPRDRICVSCASCIAGEFFTTEPPGKPKGPVFISKITQQIYKTLEIRYFFQAAWRSQSSGKVEKMNDTLKWAIVELCQETGEKWVQVLPVSLRRIRAAPKE